MFRNYFITAPRNFLRNRTQALIQVISLAVGITAAISISLYVLHEKIQAELSSIFPQFTPDFYKYDFLEETYARQYEKDDRTGRIILNFAIVVDALRYE